MTTTTRSLPFAGRNQPRSVTASPVLGKVTSSYCRPKTAGDEASARRYGFVTRSATTTDTPA